MFLFPWGVNLGVRRWSLSVLKDILGLFELGTSAASPTSMLSSLEDCKKIKT